MSLLGDIRSTPNKPDHGKVLLHGQSGTGKTSTAASIRLAAKTLYLYVPGEEGINSLPNDPKRLTVHRVSSVKEVSDIRRSLEVDPEGYGAVVFESTSAYVPLVARWLQGYTWDAEVDVMSRPATDFAFWGKIGNYFQDFFTSWYALASSSRGDKALHVIMTSQTKALDDVEGAVMMQPDMPKTPLAAALSRPDYVLYTHAMMDPEDSSKQKLVVRCKPSASVYAKIRCDADIADTIPDVVGTNQRLTLPAFLKTFNVAGV